MKVILQLSVNFLLCEKCFSHKEHELSISYRFEHEISRVQLELSRDEHELWAEGC